MSRSFDRRKRLQFLRSPAEVETVPKVAADSHDARQPCRKIAESDRLDEIIQPFQHRTDSRQSDRFIRDGDYEKNGCARQRRVDALRIDRHPVPILPRHLEILPPYSKENNRNTR